VTPSAAEAVVDFRSADIGYDGQTIVHGLGLRIDRGEAVAVLGANGSGKSTLIRGLLGLATIQHGVVEVFGVDRRRFVDWGRVGYVPQRSTIGGGIPTTVREVVASGLLTTVRPFRRTTAADRHRIDDAIDAVGLSTQSRSSLSTLSGGQQRRVLIARAIASGPDLLILDEPTAGVDRANKEVLATILANLVGAGTTIVLVTHELGPARPVVTRAIVLADGAVVHDGSLEGAPDEHHDSRHDDSWHDDSWHHHHGTQEPPESGFGIASHGILGLDGRET